MMSRQQTRDEQREERFVQMLERARDSNFAWIMNHPEGRAFMWWILEQSEFMESSFDTNALEMARKTGLKEFGQMLFKMINRTCPELYVTMATEQNKKLDGYRDAADADDN